MLCGNWNFYEIIKSRGPRNSACKLGFIKAGSLWSTIRYQKDHRARVLNRAFSFDFSDLLTKIGVKAPSEIKINRAISISGFLKLSELWEFHQEVDCTILDAFLSSALWLTPIPNPDGWNYEVTTDQIRINKQKVITEGSYPIVTWHIVDGAS